MGVTVEMSEGIAIVSAESACTEAGARELREAVEGVGAVPVLVIDFGELNMIDSAHVALLLVWARDADRSRRFAVTVSGRASEAIEDWHIDDFVSIHSERGAALADVSKVV